MNRFKLIASVYLLFIKNNKILLLRRANTGYEDGKYGLPSGHLEENESLTQGMAREVSEEIGITISPEEYTLVEVLHRKENDERMDFFFTLKTTSTQKPQNAEPDKYDDLSWFSLDALPENIIGYIKTAIENYRNNTLFTEIGFEK